MDRVARKKEGDIKVWMMRNANKGKERDIKVWMMRSAKRKGKMQARDQRSSGDKQINQDGHDENHIY